MPLSLKLIGGSSTDNESLQVTLRAIWNQQGNLSGTVDGFKAKIAGLVVSAKSLVLRVGEFEAGQVDVSKADNPDVPNLDPTKPDLLFSFQKLVYGNNRWSIKGATVPINNWEFGDAFRMTNQTIGLVEDAAAQTLAFQFNSTMNFGAAASGTPVPITLKIGRTLLNGVSKPNFEAGLQNMTPKIGSLTLNLQGVSFAGNVGEDFYGLKATTFSLQWPANLGGQTAAGLTNFKLGIGKDKHLKFSLGAVNFGVPAMENSLMKLTMQGTADVVGDTPTITSSARESGGGLAGASSFRVTPGAGSVPLLPSAD